MPTYRLTKWKLGKNPEPLETREVQARNAGEACKCLDWKIFECSYEFISSELYHWNSAKERIRSAYRRTPVISGLSWVEHDDLFYRASEMDDIELIIAVAQEVERMADILDPNATGPDIEERLTDTYLLQTFAMWRELGSKAEHIRTHCRYCGQKAELVRWEIPLKDAISKDKAHYIYVCLTNESCWQEALTDGYNAISGNRRQIVEFLVKQGRSQSDILGILDISRSTISKDIRILRERGVL